MDSLAAWGDLRPVDVSLARMLGRRGNERNPSVLLAAALVSRAAATGDVCVLIEGLAGSTVTGPAEDPGKVVYPAHAEWMAALHGSEIVSDDGRNPLVLDAGGRLFLQRNWHYEQVVAAEIRARARAADDPCDIGAVMRAVHGLFPADPPATPYGGPGASPLGAQALAAVLVALRPMAVITGGPGTGKTTGLAKIVALLAELRADQPLRLGLAAPTGKGANRMQSALRDGLDALNVSSKVRATLPREALTLHRLLGARRGQDGFSYGRKRPLPLDVLFVDEASMIDLRVMSHLLEAMPPEGKLVLLGDPDQLASVETGAVLGEVCRASTGFSHRLARKIYQESGISVPLTDQHAPALPDLHLVLDKRYRFGATDALGQLADAVREGEVRQALTLLRSAETVRLRPLGGRDGDSVRAGALAGYAVYLEQVGRDYSPSCALSALGTFQLLSPFRYGPFGTEHLNALVEGAMGGARTDGIYSGRPIMVVRNDYDAGLFNGDVGVLLPSGPSGSLHAHFPLGLRAEPATRPLSVARLPECEPAFALTVHKSQGSEFDQVMLVLPERERFGAEAPITRELLYTAITRACERVEIWGTEAAVARAIATPARRASGLAAALGQAAPRDDEGNTHPL